MSTLDFTQRAAAEYLTTRGVAMSESLLSNIGKLGYGPAFRRIGNQKLFTISDLDSWIEEQRQHAKDGTAPGGTGHQTQGR